MNRLAGAPAEGKRDVEIRGLVAAIVGGASGMARATAELLAERGAKVAILDRPASAGEQVAAGIGGDAFFHALDVRDSGSIGRALDAVVERLGGLHVGINTAGGGIARRTLAKEGPHALEDFRAVIELNLVGSFDFLRLCAERMARNAPNADGERGVVISTASIAAFEGQIGQVAYAAAKSGIVGMTFVAARDLGSLGVRAMAIAPSLFANGPHSRHPRRNGGRAHQGRGLPEAHGSSDRVRADGTRDHRESHVERLDHPARRRPAIRAEIGG